MDPVVRAARQIAVCIEAPKFTQVRPASSIGGPPDQRRDSMPTNGV